MRSWEGEGDAEQEEEEEEAAAACIATPVEASAKKKQQLVPLQLVFQTLIMIQLLKVTVKVIMIYGNFYKMSHKSYYSNPEFVSMNINCEFLLFESFCFLMNMIDYLIEFKYPYRT